MAPNAQSSTEGLNVTRETEIRGYWVDPSTSLMWAWKDNGKNLSWHGATKYCRNLRLAGYADWRLAKIDELEGLADTRNLLLTAPRLWSSNPVMDDRGHPSHASYWYFDYQRGKKQEGFEDWAEGDHMPALCVRRSGE